MAKRDATAWLAAPALLAIVVFMLIPMGLALVTSFLTPTPYGGVRLPGSGSV